MPNFFTRSLLLIAGSIVADLSEAQVPLRTMVRAAGDAQAAPHGKGNVYAPHVLIEDGRYRMWFGGQGKDGHDRIQLAESDDGLHWQTRGVVLEESDANHVNDPCVVKHGSDYWMYYTRAASDILDEIALATSEDGVRWTKRGIVLRPSPPGNWDSLLVGRPSVLVEGDLFRMWYDGRQDLPLNAPASNVPKSKDSIRAVGYATSRDGIHWTRPHSAPVFGDNAGGVDVVRLLDGYAMVYEGRNGTRLATSTDGLAWKPRGLLAEISGTATDRYGHVTPFVLTDAKSNPIALFVGAAGSASWDRNEIVRIELSRRQRELLQSR